ncbi:hypothetical protein C3486_22240 [Streptomyces sp. Ru73]|uniref:hypothetical protein n=1 Tax=Streptomyces sp. Ru73 TaxID=2080748 RepID=UPI000CDD9A77|nr:hypothetical protein [Streptomyces sp. Ru73]POX38634.1 hypothetical protein C3486_22240 [Streptomyces sp. Ru73]
MSDESFRAEAHGEGRAYQAGRDQYITEDHRTFHVHGPPPGHTPAPTSAERLARGEELLAAGESARAAAVLREALRAAEADAQAQGLSLAGRQGPRIVQSLFQDVHGPFRNDLSVAQTETLRHIAGIQYALGRALLAAGEHAESEYVLRIAVGLLWRTRGTHHPDWATAQMHRALAAGLSGRWDFAMSLASDVYAAGGRERLGREHPREAALVELVHARLLTEAAAHFHGADAGTRAVRDRSGTAGRLLGRLNRALDRGISELHAEQADWDTARSAARRSVRACAAAYGDAHPYTKEARALLIRAERGA